VLAMFVDERCPTHNSDDLCWFQFLGYLKHLPKYFQIKYGGGDSKERDLAVLKTFNGVA
jgi:hypothetical protein